jgi:glutathione S-transferase
MGMRTRGLDIQASARRSAADRAARAQAEAVIQRWNGQLAVGRDMLWSPTIRAALLAGTPWLDGLTSGSSIVTRSPRLVRWCSGCGALGARARRRCRS